MLHVHIFVASRHIAMYYPDLFLYKSNFYLLEKTMTKMMKTEDMIAANTVAIANMQSVANTALAAVESLAALNLGFARESLNNSSKQAHAALSAKNPQEVAALQAQAAKPAAENAAKSAPFGADVALAAVKQAVAAGNAAYANFSKATQQATEMAEANISKATSAAVRAAKAK